MGSARSAWIGYGVSLGGAAVVAALLSMLVPLSSERALLLPFVLPILLGAHVGGVGAGLAGTAFVVAMVFAPHFTSDGEPWSGGDTVAVGSFVVVGIISSWLLDRTRRRFPTTLPPYREAVEEALRESEERYRAIVETQSEMVCRFRVAGEILFVNGGYARACGATPDALIGRDFWDFVADEDRVGVRAMLERLTPEMREIRIENRFEAADGVRWTLWTNRALSFDESHRCIEAQSTGIDITDRKEAEEALRDANRLPCGP